MYICPPPPPLSYSYSLRRHCHRLQQQQPRCSLLAAIVWREQQRLLKDWEMAMAMAMAAMAPIWIYNGDDDARSRPYTQKTISAMAGFSFSFFSLFYATSGGRASAGRLNSIQFNDETRQVQCSNTRHAPARPQPFTLRRRRTSSKSVYTEASVRVCRLSRLQAVRERNGRMHLHCPLLACLLV